MWWICQRAPLTVFTAFFVFVSQWQHRLGLRRSATLSFHMAFTGIMSHQTLSSSHSSGGPNLRKRRQIASDESYHPANSPSGAQSANPDESPKKRKKLATSLAPDTENGVILAYNKAAGKPQDLISRCCINEISSEDHPIQFSHVIASATSREDASKAIFSTHHD